MYLLAFFGTAFVSLFLVVDVATNMPIFLSLTEKYSVRDRKNIARRALLSSCVRSSTPDALKDVRTEDTTRKFPTD